MLRIILAMVLLFGSAYAEETGSADLNSDGVVNVADFLIFLQQFGSVMGDDTYVADLKASDVLRILMEMDIKLSNLALSANQSIFISARFEAVEISGKQFDEVDVGWVTIKIREDELGKYGLGYSHQIMYLRPDFLGVSVPILAPLGTTIGRDEETGNRWCAFKLAIQTEAAQIFRGAKQHGSLLGDVWLVAVKTAPVIRTPPPALESP